MHHAETAFLIQPLCDNHDDGESEALILCNHCGNLCGECDRVLHYSRKNKEHQRQVTTLGLWVCATAWVFHVHIIKSVLIIIKQSLSC